MMMGTQLCCPRVVSLPRRRGALGASPSYKGYCHREQPNKVCLGRPTRRCQEGCWPWRLALVGSKEWYGGEVAEECFECLGSSNRQVASIEFHKPTKPRVRHTRPWSSCAKSSNRGNCHSSSKSRARVNLTKLGTPTLWRYWKHFNLVSMNPNPSKEELFHGVQQHFQSQQRLDELQVILDFIHTAKRLKTLYNS